MDAPTSGDGQKADIDMKGKDPDGPLALFVGQSQAGLSDEVSMTPGAGKVNTRDPQSHGSGLSSILPSRLQREPSGSSSAESLAGLILEASKNTVLSWWNQEEIECIACGNNKRDLQDVTIADDSSPGALNQWQDGASASPSAGRSSHSLLELSASNSYQSAGLSCGLSSLVPSQSPSAQRADSNKATMDSSKKIKLGFALEQQLQKIKGQSPGTTSSSSSTQCSSNSSDGGGSSSIPSKTLNWKDRWANFVKRIGDAIAFLVTALAMMAARNPYLCIFSTVLVSLVLVGAGCYFNFTLVVDNIELWPPGESFSVTQQDWLYEVSDFNYEYRFVDMIVHADGNNVLSQEGIARVFDAMSVIQDTSDYQQGCHWADLVGDANRVGECHIHSVSQFWNDSFAVFEDDVQTDTDALTALTAGRFPSGQAVDLARIVGNPEFDANGTATYAESFLVEFDLPWSYETPDFEWEALTALHALQEEWNSEEGNMYRLEIVAFRSYEDEFMRAIVSDLPLLPAVFVVMCLFCCMVFWRYDRVQSRSLLGMGAVVCILLSIMASHGLMFLCGVPFTTSTSMLPFLMFGIGLDDAFIIIGSYSRTQGKDVLKRIETTMKEISLSIFITTFTSTLAFTLGCFSDIPAVRWLCIYAAPSVAIDFVFQITFFIALIVLDERRIQDGRMDCCTCVHVKNIENGEDEEKAAKSEQAPPTWQPVHEKHWADRFMGWYADKLLHPTVQIFVLVFYVALLAGSIYATTTLTQYFDLNDMVPHDSYMRGYYTSLKSFAKERTGLPSYAFFRDIDHSDAFVQQQMIQFVDDLAANGAIAARPANFWLRDFLEFANETETTSQSNLTFNDQVEAFLQQPLYNDIYGDHIVRDVKTGNIVNSRCEVYVDVDLADAKGGIEALHLLRQVASAQPINEGLHGGDWKFFTYQDMYNLWEFYSTVVAELSFSTVIGIASVSLVALFLIPHWTAVLFITPMIVSLYTGMLGYISYSNIHVNAISYVQVIMSIGLMVDYLVHILMRYYESEGTRQERVKHTLETMGSSVFVGGVSSLLGVCLLAFSTSEILNMVFVAVLGLVVLGILHGLVFLPVILSLAGPESPKEEDCFRLRTLASF